MLDPLRHRRVVHLARLVLNALLRCEELLWLQFLRSYAYELDLIGKEQDEGSQRHKAVFKLAKRSFDRGDGARLTTGMPL
jgi:hypothetical protein